MTESILQVTVSPKYQVVIPKEIRMALRLKPGMKLSAVVDGESITFARPRPIKELRGILKGGPEFTREADREV